MVAKLALDKGRKVRIQSKVPEWLEGRPSTKGRWIIVQEFGAVCDGRAESPEPVLHARMVDGFTFKAMLQDNFKQRVPSGRKMEIAAVYEVIVDGERLIGPKKIVATHTTSVRIKYKKVTKRFNKILAKCDRSNLRRLRKHGPFR
jgi:hypothetical protein